MSISEFNDNVVIITGASSGIGYELAIQLAAQGAWLSLAARNAEKLEEAATECRKRGGKAMAIPTDVSQKPECQNLIERTAAEYGRIDTLINNAGISMGKRFDELQDLDIFDRIIQINYLGSVYCTYYALPYLKQTSGRIVGISSISGKVGLPTSSGYAASKHAMAGFFDSLRIELADEGVSVTMIYPSFVATKGRKARPGILSGIMQVETCAQMIIQAAAKRKRELVMTALGKTSIWAKLIAPGLVDRFSRQAVAGVRKSQGAGDKRGSA